MTIADKFKEEAERYGTEIEKARERFEALRARGSPVSQSSGRRELSLRSPRYTMKPSTTIESDQSLVSSIRQLRKSLETPSGDLENHQENQRFFLHRAKYTETVQESPAWTSSIDSMSSDLGGIDQEAVEERLAQLEEEALLVKRQLGELSRDTKPIKLRKANVVIQACPRLVSGSADAVLRCNTLLQPVVGEMMEIERVLSKGAHMTAVVERRTEEAHLCCPCFVYLDIGKGTLCWRVGEEMFGFHLRHVVALFCCNEDEALAMASPPGSVFRIHFDNGAEPLQLACGSREERAQWVVGIDLQCTLLSQIQM